jgi:predicted metalloprotease
MIRHAVELQFANTKEQAMQWAGRRESTNVEDRRGVPAGGLAVGGGIGSVVIVLLYLLLGGDPGAVVQQPPQRAQQRGGAADEETKRFVGVVLADTEDVWSQLFRDQLRREYREPRLVLFTDRVQSGCGLAGAVMGPFYCPLDQKVYLDLSFFDEMRARFRAPGDFAAAYVIAHEVGHHVQHQLGIMDRVHGSRGRGNSPEANQMSVRLELQADFLAGVWAHHAQRMKQIIEEGDLEEAMGAAAAVGDDRLQRQTRGEVMPDAFTHGSSEQRVRWFRRGFESGDLSLMDELFELPYESL